MKKTIFFLSIILLSCFSFKDASCKEIEFTELKLVGAPESELPDNEKFFLVYKESLFLNVDLDHLEKYESLIGSFNKKTENDLRFANISKFPGIGVKKGEKIYFFNTKVKKIEEFEVQEKSAFKMIINPYYPDSGQYYSSFNLILTEPKDFHQFTHSDSFGIESVGYRGDKFKIRPAVERFEYPDTGKKDNVRDRDDVKKLLKAYAAKKNILVTEKNPYVSRLILGDKEIISFRIASELELVRFYKVGPNKYLTWRHPTGSTVIRDQVEFYADLIEGAEFVAIYNNGQRIYVKVFYKDRIESYLTWDTYGVI
ncbi:MAG TPA: hypothetical protein VKZ84_02485 [Bacteriovoracaceae bacterium]|nr:hypothetical protein [Bacteriovoracaceae bacterium]